MFGLAQLVVWAERDLREKTMHVYDEPRLELQVWLWRHKALFFVAGVLVLLIIGVNAV
jgi:hypothetical protein